MTNSWHDKAAEIPEAEVRFGRPLAYCTSFGVGGPAECLVEPASTEGLCATLRVGADCGVPLWVMGNGTNVLVRDGGVPGITLRVAESLSGLEVSGTHIRALAGTSLSQLCERAAMCGLAGIEFLAGIPGTTGGAVVMNAGAWEHSISEVIREVRVADRDGTCYTLTPDQLDFGYRHTALQDGERVVLDALFELAEGDERVIRDRMLELAVQRCARQPVCARSAGSTFERPPDDYAGRLIEEAGLKGYRLGGACVSPKHANFLINSGDATARDILDLIEYVKAQVMGRFEVPLQAEVRIVGVESAGEPVPEA